MPETDKAPMTIRKAWSSEQESIDPKVEIELIKKEIRGDKDIMDEVSFYRQTKFSKADAEKITKKALGENAFKRSDDPDIPKIKEKEYQEVEKLAPQIQIIWRKMEKERIRAKFQLNEVVQEKLKNGLTENEIKELNELSSFLEEKIDTLDDIQWIIIEKKTPVEIIKTIDSAIEEFNDEGVDESITILSNYKDQISKIITNKEMNFMNSKESSIIDPELQNQKQAEIIERRADEKNDAPEASAGEFIEKSISDLEVGIENEKKEVQEEIKVVDERVEQGSANLNASTKSEIKDQVAEAGQELQDKVSGAEKDADHQRKEVALTPKEAIKVEIDKDGKAIGVYIGSSGLETMIRDQMKGEIEKIYIESDFKNKSKGKRNKMVKPGNKIYDQAILAAEGSMKKFIEEYTGQTYEEVLQKVGLGDKNAGVMGEYVNKIIKKIARGTIEKKEIVQENESPDDELPKSEVDKDKEINLGGPRISSESFDKLKGLRDNDPKVEIEIKNPELSLKKEQLEKELSDIKFNLNVFENGKKEELDALVNHMIREGRAKGNPESKGLRNYLKKGLIDRQIALNRAKALCNQSKSLEEFYKKIQNEIDLIKNNRQKELDEISAKDLDEERKENERDRIKNKYHFRESAYLNYLPHKKEAELEPKADSGTVQSEPKIEVKPVDIKSDIQPDSQPKQSDREEVAAAYDQRIANLRLGIDEAKASGDKNEVVRLEKFARELEHEKKWRMGKADGKDQGKNINKNPKTKVQNKDAQAPKDKTAEPNNYNQEWQSLHRQIKQAEKDGKGAEVERLVQEIYKLEQNKRNAEAAARDKDREKKRMAQERKKEAQKIEQIAEIEQRIANLRLGIAEAEKENNESEVLRLEEILREVQKEQLRAEGKDDAEKIKNGKAAKKEVKIKHNEAALNIVEFSDFSGMPFKQWDKIKVKRTSGEIEDDWSVAFIDRKEGLIQVLKEEKEDNGKKGVMIRKFIPIAELVALNLADIKEEKIGDEAKTDDKKETEAGKDVVDDKSKAETKEKTAEEILREKNIEVYGGAEKLNQIFEDYKRLNDLEDKKAYYDDSPLFSEWDALRVKIANINLEAFGRDRTVDLYKIQNKDEMIREYFNTKLEEPLEDFQKDIQKASPNELAIRAATLIKYRNELKNCDWQGKDKYRDVPRKEYLEIIKILEQKIEILNGALPKKEGASPEAALKDLSIDDFKKIEKEPEYKGGYPAVIEAGPKIELTNEQSARVEKILKDFDLTAGEAEKIEGFKDLSYGQRLLALQNLRQLTLRDVRIGAVETQKEETAQTKGFFRKVWKSIKKRYDIAKHEKSIANDLNKEDYAATLAQLARGMKELKTDVVENNGRLEFQYVSGLENLAPEQAARVQRFNEVASELSKLPMEWTADDSKKGFFRQMMDKAGLGQAWSPDDPTRSQHRRTGELNAEFQSLKQEVVRIIKQQKDSDLKNAGVEKFDDLETQSHATAQMLQIENLLRCNRAMNVNPDAEKALLEIKSAPLWKRALNNIATEKGIYFVAGFAARSVSVSLLGTAGIIGGAAGMGGYMGYKRGKETLRENDALAQHKDFEETKKKRIEKFQRAKQGKAEQAGEAEKTEKRIEDANVLARNLNNFVEYIKEEDDPKRRMDLSRRLRDRVKFVKDALDQGRINFGATGERAASLYELTDKLNDAVNCVEIYHPSTRHEADQWSEANQSEVMEKLNQYLAESKIELDAERRKYLVKQLAKGALYGAGFASAGMIARELFSHLDPHLFNAQGETDLGVRWISGSGSGKPLVGGIVGKYIHGGPGDGSGGSIPPHEAGMPAGGGSGKSAYEAFMDNKPKDYNAFPQDWPMKPIAQPEIQMGQGSFAERFLRAVGMHEGSPVKPDLQKIVAEYSEYFRSHPDLLKNNNSSLEYLNHLKSDLQSAGLDGRAADSIVKNFSTEMGKIGTGIYPEGEIVPGIETVGVSGGGGSTVEQAAAAAEAGKTVEVVAGAKQDILNSAVETASGKMDSVWKMIDHQLDQRGVFKGLIGTPEEIAAKKTYMIDYFKDIVAKSPKEFGLKDIDDLQIGQKVDLSKLFDNPSRFGEIIRDTNVLPADKLASIFEHDQTIAEFHKLHPDIGITSENVDQIASGHGEALLKKAVAQAASEQVQPSAPEMPIQDEVSRVAPEPWDSRLKQEFKVMPPEGQAEAAAKQAVDKQLNEIFKYPFGRQGAETMTYQDIKNGSAEGFLKRDFFKEMAGNHDLDVSEKDALMHDVPKYENLQKHLNDLIQKSGSRPRAGETVDQFISRANHNIATNVEHSIPETVADKAMPPHESPQELEIDKEFFNEKPASPHETAKAAADIGHAAQAEAVNNMKINTDKLAADIEFKYNSSGQPVDMEIPSVKAGSHIDHLAYLDKNNLQSFDARTEGTRLSTYMEIYNKLKVDNMNAESGVVAEKIKNIVQNIEKTRSGIIDYSKLPQEIREKLPEHLRK